ncbi:VVA0879 family protein [Ciceribacter thiooxidans]|uniref:VVA0879 family protein n=1 Tax=Ciceribacter thiooxidans TaxID=1969821 RepID=A0ABV7I4H7_9HYPH|nr:VVA0879 family protein [Ciceribacter thiooxidans]
MAEVIPVKEFHRRLNAQGVSGRQHVALRCPMCGTVQSATSLIKAGAGSDFDAVEKYLGFSCVGRFTGAGSPREKPDGEPCNWTLGGVFTLHTLEVETTDGKRHPRFEVATPEEAQALEASHG